MSVVARMAVYQVTQSFGGATQIVLTPRVPQTNDPHYDEIAAFYAATPGGKFEATIKNELAAEQFQLGDEFYITLDKIEK